jgi:hypothetical protein
MCDNIINNSLQGAMLLIILTKSDSAFPFMLATTQQGEGAATASDALVVFDILC